MYTGYAASNYTEVALMQVFLLTAVWLRNVTQFFGNTKKVHQRYKTNLEERRDSTLRGEVLEILSHTAF